LVSAVPALVPLVVLALELGVPLVPPLAINGDWFMGSAPAPDAEPEPPPAAVPDASVGVNPPTAEPLPPEPLVPDTFVGAPPESAAPPAPEPDELASGGGNQKSFRSPPDTPTNSPPVGSADAADVASVPVDARFKAIGSSGSQLVSGWGGSPMVGCEELSDGKRAIMAKSPTAVAIPESGSVNW
jgi:hypothetical protein